MLRRNGKPRFVELRDIQFHHMCKPQTLTIHIRSCEPCRISKIKCDHATPTCQKCQARGMTEQVREPCGQYTACAKGLKVSLSSKPHDQACWNSSQKARTASPKSRCAIRRLIRTGQVNSADTQSANSQERCLPCSSEQTLAIPTWVSYYWTRPV